jgi:hypothetical protein
MMAFTMPACARKTGTVEFLRCLLLLVALLALTPGSARAEGVNIASAGIVLSDEGYVLNADFNFDLNSKLLNALAHGVALHFVTELRVDRTRWYWFDKSIAHRRLEYRLTYHAMTRSYRLSIGNLHRNFDSLPDAVNTMKHVRNLYVASPKEFDNKDKYVATLRFFHNTALLPKPFQLSALANADWELNTGWMEWSFIPETVGAESTAAGTEPPEKGTMPGETVTE